jgi:hypothetical protein
MPPGVGLELSLGSPERHGFGPRGFQRSCRLRRTSRAHQAPGRTAISDWNVVYLRSSDDLPDPPSEARLFLLPEEYATMIGRDRAPLMTHAVDDLRHG